MSSPSPPPNAMNKQKWRLFLSDCCFEFQSFDPQVCKVLVMRFSEYIVTLVVVSCAVTSCLAAPRKSKRTPAPESVPAVEEDKRDIKDSTRAKKQTTTFCVEIKAGKPVTKECEEHPQKPETVVVFPPDPQPSVSYVQVPVVHHHQPQYPTVYVNGQPQSQQPGNQPGSSSQPGYQPGSAQTPGWIYPSQPGSSGQPGQQPGSQSGSSGQPGQQPGYQPGLSGQPGYQPGSSGQPGYQPGSSGRPGYPQGSPGQPGYQPGSSGQPGYQSGSSGQPGYQPGSSGQPGSLGQPGHKPGSSGQPGYQPGSSGQPGYQPASSGKPGYPTGPTGQSAHEPGSPLQPGKAGNRPATSSQIAYRPGSPGQQPGTQPGSPGHSAPQSGSPDHPGQKGGVSSQPGNQPGFSDQPSYQLVLLPGQPGYQPGSPGQPDYLPASPGQPGYQPGSLGQPGHQPGSPGQPGYQPGSPGQPSGEIGYNPQGQLSFSTGTGSFSSSLCPPCPPCPYYSSPFSLIFRNTLGEQPELAIDPRMMMVPGMDQRTSGGLIPGDPRLMMDPGMDQRTPGGLIPGDPRLMMVPGMDQRSSGGMIPGDPRFIIVPGMDQRSPGGLMPGDPRMMTLQGPDQRDPGLPLGQEMEPGSPGARTIDQRGPGVVISSDPRMMMTPGYEQGRPWAPGSDQRMGFAPTSLDMRITQPLNPLEGLRQPHLAQFQRLSQYPPNQPIYEFKYGSPEGAAHGLPSGSFRIGSGLPNSGSLEGLPGGVDPRCREPNQPQPTVVFHPSTIPSPSPSAKFEYVARSKWAVRSADQAGSADDNAEGHAEAAAATKEVESPGASERKAGLTPSQLMSQMKATAPAQRSIPEDKSDSNVQMSIVGPGGQSYLLGSPKGALDGEEKRQELSKRKAETLENVIE